MLALLVFAGEPPTARAQAGTTLVRSVTVMRHGVRTPTIPYDELDGWTVAPWPRWKEPTGALTERGATLATELGRWQRAYLASEKLVPPEGCPTAGEVSIYADVSSRTIATAQALIDGLLPGCARAPATKAPASVDPLFHPLEAAGCTLDARRAEAEVLARFGGKWDAALAPQRDALALMQKTVGTLNPALCARLGRPASCTIADLPTSLAFGAAAAGVELRGGLMVASDMAELFLLEYANGMPPEHVAWGRAGAGTIRALLPLHDLAFDLMERTPYLAARKGSALLAYAAAATVAAPVRGVPPAGPDAKIVVVVGHDTNLANLGALLNATWSPQGWPDDETPPAGGLRFELRTRADGTSHVYVGFVVQSLEQMRAATPLTLAAPPVVAPLRIPACSADVPGYPCPVEAFVRAVESVLDVDCLADAR